MHLIKMVYKWYIPHILTRNPLDLSIAMTAPEPLVLESQRTLN